MFCKLGLGVEPFRPPKADIAAALRGLLIPVLALELNGRMEKYGFPLIPEPVIAAHSS
jgi:hypothetical protein